MTAGAFLNPPMHSAKGNRQMPITETSNREMNGFLNRRVWGVGNVLELMRTKGELSALASMVSSLKYTIFGIALLLCAIALPTHAQTDPLNNAYKPSIDCTPGDYPSNVSLTNLLAKLRQTADSPTSIMDYGTTPLPCITIGATQNDKRAFQVNVQAPVGGYASLTVTMSNLVKSTGPGGNYTIASENIPFTFSSGSESGTTATFTISSGAPYVGEDLLIQNCSVSGYNGGGLTGAGVRVTAATSTTFQFTTVASGLGAPTGCTITPVDIITYAEGYQNVSTRTGPTGGTTSTLFGTTGLYPDPLIPTIDPYFGQTTGAFPISVSASNNQSALIDVYIPAGAPSGWYLGTATIKNSGTTIAALPVLYEVWQWPVAQGGHMPSNPSLKTSIYTSFDNLCRLAYGSSGDSTCAAAYPGSYSGIIDDLGTELDDNRLTLGNGNAFLENISYATLTTAETKLLGGLEPGRLTPIMQGATWGPMGLINHGKTLTDNTAFQTWMTTFATNGWSTFRYLLDEPGTSSSSWSTINTTAATDRTYSHIIPELVTTQYGEMNANSGTNSIDYLISLLPCSSYPASKQCNSQEPAGPYEMGNDSNLTTWLAGNCCSGAGPTRQLWRYTDCEPACGGSLVMNYPSYFVDQLPVANEAMEWTSEQANLGTAGFTLTGELYFLADNCFYNTCGGAHDPWTSVLSTGDNGDGTLVYYGTNSAHCPACPAGAQAVNVSTPIFLPTIRLLLYREGVEDYEYMALLAKSYGEASAVKAAISSWMTNSYTFNIVSTAPSGSFTGDMTDAQNTLGADVHQITFPSGGSTVSAPGNPLITRLIEMFWEVAP